LVKAKEPGEIRRRLAKLIKQEGFEDKGFEIGIERLKSQRAVAK